MRQRERPEQLYTSRGRGREREREIPAMWLNDFVFSAELEIPRKTADLAGEQEKQGTSIMINYGR